MDIWDIFQIWRQYHLKLSFHGKELCEKCKFNKTDWA